MKVYVVAQCKDCKWLDMTKRTSVGYLCTNTTRTMYSACQQKSLTSLLKPPTAPACKTGFEPKDM